MKKSELKNGMVVRYRNTSYSKYALVVDNLFIGLDGFMPLISYNEDLTYKIMTNKKDLDFTVYDIVAVYEVNGFDYGLQSVLSGKHLIPLWEEEK